MKLKAETDGSTDTIALQRDGSGLSAQVDDRHYELILREFAGGFLLIDGTEVYSCHVSGNTEHRERFEVSLQGKRWDVRIVDAKRARTNQVSGSHDHGASELRATMPGKVVRVLVELGAAVEAGVGIIVVEAMKMQNEMKTPKSGTVAKLNATVGETVNAGDLLAVIE
jgi:biotin carboxyl carrier protein